MKKITLTISLILMTISIYAQFIPNSNSGFAVDTIKLDNRGFVPKLRSINGDGINEVKKINDWILDAYVMSNWSGDQRESQYYPIKYLEGYQIDENILAFKFYMLNYSSDNIRLVFFSLESGNQITPSDFNFSSILKYDRYFPFILKYWFKEKEKARIYDTELGYPCNEYDPDISNSYIVDEFSVLDSTVVMSFSTSEPAGSKYGSCGGVFIRKRLPKEVITPYLNDFGKKIINNVGYSSKNTTVFYNTWGEDTSIDQIKFFQKLNNESPTSNIYFGRINGKYSFKMIINITSNGSESLVNGIYYYDSKPDTGIRLKGYKEFSKLEFDEYYKGKITGHFSLTLGDKGNVVSGTWTNADGTKTYDIEFDSTF